MYGMSDSQPYPLNLGLIKYEEDSTQLLAIKIRISASFLFLQSCVVNVTCHIINDDDMILRLPPFQI